MQPARRAGRIIGALILAQMVGSALVNLVLTAPLVGEPDFLVNAAAHSRQIGLSVVFGLATNAIFVAIAITAFPVFRQYSQALALWFVDRKSTRLNSSHIQKSRMPSSA